MTDLKSGTWDRNLTNELIQKGFSREQASIVVGIVAEHRQDADRVGYVRGYNNGCRDTQHQLNRLQPE